MEEQIENVAEEIQHEEVVHSQEKNNHSPEESAYQKELSDKDINFNKLRDSKERLERENRELRQAMERSAQPKQPVVQEDEIGIDDDDLVEGKVVKKLYKEINNLKKTYEQSKLAEVPDRLKAKFQDFDQVVTQENIDKLKETEPELYNSITSGNDLYTKSVSAYKTIKSLGFVESSSYDAQKEQVQKNHGRPISAQAIRGQGALSEANIFARGLTPELKDKLQKEMESAIKAR